MSIQFNGHTYWLQVQPGECGVEQFKDDVRRLLGLSAAQAFDITFECRVPGAGARAAPHLIFYHEHDATIFLIIVQWLMMLTCY